MATTNMNLQLPTVLTTLGPEWANQVNAAFEVVDRHDHSDGKGVKITPQGLNINSEVDFQTNRAFNLQSTQYDAQTAAQTGASNANSIYSVNGNLYWTNGSGVAIQLTSGGTLIPSPGSITTYERASVASDLVINPSATTVLFTVDTSVSRNITLPLAAAVSDGRIYIIKDISGTANANNITLTAAGSDNIDGQASIALDSNYGSWTVVGDGVDAWFVN